MQQYQRAQVESASPTRLVVLLYEGAIRFCSLAQAAMRARDLETQNANLIRAQRIVGELLASLNRAEGGEVASNLARIYAHLLEELVKANLYDQEAALEHAIRVLTDMRATWVELDRITSSEGNAALALGRNLPGPGAAASRSAGDRLA
jgi:flagellar secretion chaperone FliS